MKREDLETTKTKGKYLIGRDPKRMDFVVDQSISDISRRHCSISYENKLGWLIKDEFSVSGSYLTSVI